MQKRILLVIAIVLLLVGATFLLPLWIYKPDCLNFYGYPTTVPDDPGVGGDLRYFSQEFQADTDYREIERVDIGFFNNGTAHDDGFLFFFFEGGVNTIPTPRDGTAMTDQAKYSNAFSLGVGSEVVASIDMTYIMKPDTHYSFVVAYDDYDGTVLPQRTVMTCHGLGYKWEDSSGTWDWEGLSNNADWRYALAITTPPEEPVGSIVDTQWPSSHSGSMTVSVTVENIGSGAGTVCSRITKKIGGDVLSTKSSSGVSPGSRVTHSHSFSSGSSMWEGRSEAGHSDCSVSTNIDDYSGYVSIPYSSGNSPPIAEFTITPNPANTGEEVTFDGSDSVDSDGTIDLYEWDIDNDGFDDGTGEIITKTFSSSGYKTIQLQVTDNDGATDTVSHTLRVDEPIEKPIAKITTPKDGLSYDSPVEFDGSDSSDPDGTYLWYDWDIIDANSNEISVDGPNSDVFERELPSGGTIVTLRVQDGDGQWSNEVEHQFVVLGAVDECGNGNCTEGIENDPNNDGFCPEDCCDNDGICEENEGENPSSCADCVDPTVCDNDGICEPEQGETTSNCPDCVEEPKTMDITVFTKPISNADITCTGTDGFSDTQVADSDGAVFTGLTIGGEYTLVAKGFVDGAFTYLDTTSTISSSDDWDSLSESQGFWLITMQKEGTELRSITITTEPPGCDVWLDLTKKTSNETTGEVIFDNVADGYYQLKIKKEGYKTFELEINIPDDTPSDSVTFTLETEGINPGDLVPVFDEETMQYIVPVIIVIASIVPFVFKNLPGGIKVKLIILMIGVFIAMITYLFLAGFI